MILVDSSVWIDYFNGLETVQAAQLDGLLSRPILLVGDLIYTEVLQGFRSDADFRMAKRLLDCFPFVSIGGKEVAQRSADGYRHLRKEGITVRKTIDMIIASYCILNEVTLLHNDADFHPIEKHLGLRVFQPEEQNQ